MSNKYENEIRNIIEEFCRYLSKGFRFILGKIAEPKSFSEKLLDIIILNFLLSIPGLIILLLAMLVKWIMC